MAKITVDDLEERGRFTAGEFDWDDRTAAASIYDWLNDVVTVASAKLQADVGATNYASATTPMATLLKQAELYSALAMGLERRLDMLTGRPEEAPPPEYIDTSMIERQIASYRAQYEDLIGPYRVTSETRTGAAWCFGATGIDETPTDDHTGYGNIEDSATIYS